MPQRSAAQLDSSALAWHEAQARERHRIYLELMDELDRARANAEPWLRWLEDRIDGVHRHELVRDDGSPIACPVAGCDAVRGSSPAAAPAGERARPPEPLQLAL